MIDANDVCGIVVTRGNVELTRVLRPLEPLGEVIIWNNALDQDLSVFGRYQAIAETDKPVILVVDDDIALTPEAVDGLLAAYQPGKIVANMPQKFRRAWYTNHCLVGLGAIFDRELPQRAFNALAGNSAWNGEDQRTAERFFYRTCDVAFTALTPFQLVDLPITILPYAYGDDRMYKQPSHHDDRARMLELARKVRDA